LHLRHLLVDALVSSGLERGRYDRRVLAVRLGNLRQRGTRQLLLELGDRNANGLRGNVQVLAEARRSAALAAGPALTVSSGGSAQPRPRSSSWRADIAARLSQGGLERGHVNPQSRGECVEVALVPYLSRSRLSGGAIRRRLGAGDSNRGATKQ
jgi:hypothetical protein